MKTFPSIHDFWSEVSCVQNHASEWETRGLLVRAFPLQLCKLWLKSPLQFPHSNEKPMGILVKTSSLYLVGNLFFCGEITCISPPWNMKPKGMLVKVFPLCWVFWDIPCTYTALEWERNPRVFWWKYFLAIYCFWGERSPEQIPLSKRNPSMRISWKPKHPDILVNQSPLYTLFLGWEIRPLYIQIHKSRVRISLVKHFQNVS